MYHRPGHLYEGHIYNHFVSVDLRNGNDQGLVVPLGVVVVVVPLALVLVVMVVAEVEPLGLILRGERGRWKGD